MDYLSFLSISHAESVLYIFLLPLVLLKYLLLNHKTHQKRLLERFESNLCLLSKPCLQGAIACWAVWVPLLSTQQLPGSRVHSLCCCCCEHFPTVAAPDEGEAIIFLLEKIHLCNRYSSTVSFCPQFCKLGDRECGRKFQSKSTTPWDLHIETAVTFTRALCPPQVGINSKTHTCPHPSSTWTETSSRKSLQVSKA